MNVDLGGNTLTNGYFSGIVLPDPKRWLIKSSVYNALAGDRIQADTSLGSFTITLPGVASIGDTIQIEDAALTWDSHNLIVGRNGLKINGSASDYMANVQCGKLTLTYISSSYG